MPSRSGDACLKITERLRSLPQLKGRRERLERAPGGRVGTGEGLPLSLGGGRQTLRSCGPQLPPRRSGVRVKGWVTHATKMPMISRLIEEHRERILELAARHGASNVRVFGSL